MTDSFPWAAAGVMLGQALALCMAMMFAVWLLHLPLKNAAIVDVAWPMGICASALLFCTQGSGALERRILIAGMVTFWALRLSIYLLVARVWGKPEEGRYQELRREYGDSATWRFLLFFQIQALSCVVLAIPVLFSARNGAKDISSLEWLALGVWIVAMAGELVADWQLSQFKGIKANRGLVCRDGLWAWSRHPNYFFEWLIWVSYALFALASPWGFLGILSPLLIYYFVNHVTGIPPTEAQALRSRGEAYAKYQREVSAFFPLPPRR